MLYLDRGSSLAGWKGCFGHNHSLDTVAVAARYVVYTAVPVHASIEGVLAFHVARADPPLARRRSRTKLPSSFACSLLAFRSIGCTSSDTRSFASTLSCYYYRSPTRSLHAMFVLGTWLARWFRNCTSGLPSSASFITGISTESTGCTVKVMVASPEP